MERIAALYARVSAEQQGEPSAIQSQVAALRAHLAERGVAVPPEREFLDEGYSGATLVRPALERLRDLVAAGGLDELYVHAPDRLARKYAYQVLLLEEFARAGVRVVFLAGPRGQTPEDDLLLQVQGMVAEYERARFLERSRRGKRHAAQGGAVSVLTGAPYGYRYVGKHDGAGEARYDVVLEEAAVVRQVFAWVGAERLSLSEVARRLTQAGVATRKGQGRWVPSVVWDMLKNPAYAGRAAYGKTRSGPWQPPLRPRRGCVGPPRKAVSVRHAAPEEWITIPVPALVPEALFAAVQEQLAENQRRARRSPAGVRYLLQGLLVCAHCGYAYYGKTLKLGQGTATPREHVYYRCSGSDRCRFGGTAVCDNG
jgi:site-specific DNA recombinase